MSKALSKANVKSTAIFDKPAATACTSSTRTDTTASTTTVPPDETPLDAMKRLI